MQRKNLASANVFGRRNDVGVISIGDSLSNPDFSLGAGPEIFSASGTKTAVGTDSVRPLSVSRPGIKLMSGNREMKYSVNVRPGTVGAAKTKLFRRSDYTNLRFSAAQNQNSTNMQITADDLMHPDDHD
jgi:hypothetical protein